MLFPFLLILVPAVLLIVLARWAKTDEDDLVRKIVVSIVQISCLMCMVLGVMRFAQRAANGPPPPDEDQPVASGAPSATSPMSRPPAPSGYSRTAIQPTAAEQVVAAQRAEEERQRALAAQQERDAQQAEQNRRNLEEAQRRTDQTQAGAAAPTPAPGAPDSGAKEPEAPPSGQPDGNPNAAPPSSIPGPPNPPATAPPGG